MSMIRRVLLVEQTEGIGTKDDVVRVVMYFYDEQTLELIARVDNWENEQSTKKRG